MNQQIHKIPQNSEIFRAIKKRSWVRNGVSYDAFLLRSDNNETELSVLTKAECYKDKCEMQEVFNTCFGEIVLNVDSVRSLGLEVIPTKLENVPNHASIYKLPPNQGDTEADARSIAIELAEFHIRIQPQKFKRKK
jgi:hypothetical protein